MSPFGSRFLAGARFVSDHLPARTPGTGGSADRAAPRVVLSSLRAVSDWSPSLRGSEATKHPSSPLFCAVDCFASLAMTVGVASLPRNDGNSEYDSAISRRDFRRVLQETVSPL